MLSSGVQLLMFGPAPCDLFDPGLAETSPVPIPAANRLNKGEGSYE